MALIYIWKLSLPYIPTENTTQIVSRLKLCPNHANISHISQPVLHFTNDGYTAEVSSTISTPLHCQQHCFFSMIFNLRRFSVPLIRLTSLCWNILIVSFSGLSAWSGILWDTSSLQFPNIFKQRKQVCPFPAAFDIFICPTTTKTNQIPFYFINFQCQRQTFLQCIFLFVNCLLYYLFTACIISPNKWNSIRLLKGIDQFDIHLLALLNIKLALMISSRPYHVYTWIEHWVARPYMTLLPRVRSKPCTMLLLYGLLCKNMGIKFSVQSWWMPI